MSHRIRETVPEGDKAIECLEDLEVAKFRLRGNAKARKIFLNRSRAAGKLRAVLAKFSEDELI